MYSDADVKFDGKRKNKVDTQQQFSRFSVSSDNTIIDIANRVQNPALQDLTKPQIGNPYNDTFGVIGSITQIVSFNTYGSEYSFFELNGDVDFAFIEIPQGRFVEFTLDILVATGGPSVLIQFPQVLNPPALDGNNGDHYVLKFVGVHRADDTGNTPLGTFTFEYIGGTIRGGTGGDLLPLDNVWTGNNSWTGQTFLVNTTTSATVNSPLFNVNSTLFTVGDAPTDILNIISHIGSSLIPTVTDTFQIGSSALEWNQVFTKEISALLDTTISSPILAITSALTTFGDSATDIFNFVGVIGSSLIPNLDASFDLGSVSKEWDTAWLANINAFTTTVIQSPVLQIDSLVNFQGSYSVAPTYVAGVTQVFNPSTNAGMNVGTVNGNPANLNDGDVWYNSSTDILFGRINGINIDLGAAGAATNSISQADSSLTVVDAVGFSWVLDALTIATMTANEFLLGGIELNMGDEDITGVDDIVFTQADTSIATGGLFVTHEYPNTGTWRLRHGTDNELVAVGAGITLGRSDGGIGFYGTTPITRLDVVGDTLANLLTVLRSYGLIDP